MSDAKSNAINALWSKIMSGFARDAAKNTGLTIRTIRKLRQHKDGWCDRSGAVERVFKGVGESAE